MGRGEVSRVVGVVVALAGVAVSRPALAYSKGNHKLITAEAVRLIEACGGLADVDGYTAALNECDLKQDDPWRKVTLWHFYGNGRTLGGKWTQGEDISVDNSLDRWFSLLVEAGGATSAAPATAMGYTGALIHYLQDVTVPAHAVPIFHPTPFVTVGDEFDDFELQAKNLPSDPATCQRLLGATADTFPALLKEAAELTLGIIGEEIPADAVTPALSSLPDVPQTWGMFWNTALNEYAFGTYGCVGNEFGASKLKCDGVPLSFSETTYASFARRLHVAAVEVSVRAIMIAQRASPFPAKAGATVTCPLPKKCPDSDPPAPCIEEVSVEVGGGCGPCSAAGSRSSAAVSVVALLLAVALAHWRAKRHASSS